MHILFCAYRGVHQRNCSHYAWAWWPRYNSPLKAA